MKALLFALALFLLSACVPRRQTYYMPHRSTLLYGSDSAIYAGCVRGVIRWQHDRTGQWPKLWEVQAQCVDVQRSFQLDMRDRDGDL